jgi:hypothetical protein
VATIEQDPDTTQRNRIALIALGALAAGAVVALVIFLRRPPQMGADEEVFKTVDALYTAVRSQDEKRLAVCEQRLAEHKAAGKLPKSASDYLDGVLAKARGGRWESATRSLYDFMLAQRREGHAHAAEGQPRTAEHKGRPAKGKSSPGAPR